jgi:ATP-dependent RNA helicase DHX29
MPSKKKKPAANPARGFATTSIAKKAVPEEQPAKEEAGPAEQTVGVSKQDVLNSVSQELQTASESRSVQPELHELSPEALEARLEEEEVQLLVAKYGPQVQRAVDRQVNKTSTDYRVLRGHAQFLPTRTLLPLELESKVLELAKQDLEDSAVATLPSVRNASFEEDYTTRLWTLQRILRALGFTKESVERALSFALRLGPDVDKDSPVWALDECLDWLTLKLEEDELPVYDHTTGKARDEVHDQYDSTALDVSAVATRKAKPKKSAETIVTTPSTAPTTGLPSEDEVEINVSDLESDLEPEELVTTYVASKTSLYELKPDLFDNGKKGANKSQMSSSTPATLSAVKKLQAKMQRIESDVLFDQYEADSRWLLKRNEIAQDVAERRRYQLPSHPTPAAKAADVPLARSQRQPKAVSESSSEESDIESLEDDDDAFGDLFAATAPDEKPHVTIGSDSKVDPTQIIITNFGQIQGVSPWRVLEETCKSRSVKHVMLSTSEALTCKQGFARYLCI